MTNQEMRIATAEACGWHYERTDADGGCYGWVSPTGGCLQNAPDCFPDYPNDLNAMHEAEDTLSFFQLTEMNEILANEVVPPDCRIWRATARQRDEAFLRTIGKWKD